jgi:hypothetical protein
MQTPGLVIQPKTWPITMNLRPNDENLIRDPVELETKIPIHKSNKPKPV